jgi:leucyl aminopeptidase (aminopeptidase T)
MKAATQAESSREYMNWEILQAAKKVINEIMLTQPGETVLITADTTSDFRVIQATAAAAVAAEAKPVVLTFQASLDKEIMIEPTPPVAEALKASDVWIDYQYQLFYTRAWKAAMDAGTRLFLAAACDVNMLMNTVGKVNYPKMIELGDTIVDLINTSSQMQITSPNGTDLTMSTEGRIAEQSGAYGTEKGISVMLGGQTTLCPVEESINGILVFDGGLFPPAEIGLMTSPVKLTIEKGVARKIEGGREAHLFEKWLEGLDDEKMYWLAHVSQGFNPGVLEPTGRIEEDERIFGCVECGLGTQGEGLGGKAWVAASHTDGITLNPSILLDGEAIEENGFYVHPTLAKLCRELCVAGY